MSKKGEEHAQFVPILPAGSAHLVNFLLEAVMKSGNKTTKIVYTVHVVLTNLCGVVLEGGLRAEPS